MGGSVLVGIRRRNGEIHLSERWTNATPYWFNDPDFYADDEVTLQEYLDGEDGKPQTRIHPSGYGVILVDLIKRRVLSRQDYTGIGSVTLNTTDEEKMELVVKLKERGLITRIEVWPSGGSERVLDVDEQARFFQMLEDPKPEDRLFMHEVSWAIPGLEVSDIQGGRGCNHWDDVLKWVAENEWPTPIMPMDEVRKVYELDECSSDEPVKS